MKDQLVEELHDWIDRQYKIAMNTTWGMAHFRSMIKLGLVEFPPPSFFRAINNQSVSRNTKRMKYPVDKHPLGKITVPYSVRTKSAAEMLATAKKQSRPKSKIVQGLRRLRTYFKEHFFNK
jgi:hypothetical protein